MVAKGNLNNCGYSLKVLKISCITNWVVIWNIRSHFWPYSKTLGKSDSEQQYNNFFNWIEYFVKEGARIQTSHPSNELGAIGIVVSPSELDGPIDNKY